MSNQMPVLEFNQVSHSYFQGGESLDILRSVDLLVQNSERVALIGESGTGKSTLLHLAGLLDRPSAGKIFVDGDEVTTLKDHERTLIRRNKLGFIYQFHHLLNDFTACENVMMPLMIAGQSKAKARPHAEAILKKVGLNHRLNHKPTQLSGGEQQRVAFARAMIHQPKLLLADEPTGNLDEKTTDAVFQILSDMAQEFKIATLLVTHDKGLAQKLDRGFVLQNGKLERFN